jgi:acetylornithine/N-succinyldiaminopimelate aminotransferase
MTTAIRPSTWAGTLADRASRAVMPTYSRYPIEITSGLGARVVDSSGKEYLDFIAGIATNCLGHAHPAIVAAIRENADKLLHVSNLYWTEPMVRLAERLTTASGMDRAFFCNSGAEAVEAMIKLSRKARPGRPRIVCFERSFHGRTMGALSATSQPHYQEPFKPLGGDRPRYRRRDGRGRPRRGRRASRSPRIPARPAGGMRSNRRAVALR